MGNVRSNGTGDEMAAMSDMYTRICEEAGLDMEDEGTLERVAEAWGNATGESLIDVFDNAVDALILS
jgi:hypothetical protein